MTSMNLVGIYALFAEIPLLVTIAILFVMTEVVIYIGRDLLEGLGYQVAYSAKFGDAALLGAVFIAVRIVQRGDMPVLPDWMMNMSHQFAIWVTCIAVGGFVYTYTIDAREGREMDAYHDFVVVPMFLFFTIMLLPVIYMAGTLAEQYSTIGLLLFYFATVAFDAMTGRMNQRKWMRDNPMSLD